MRSALCAILLLFGTASLSAQVVLSGFTYDGSGGPLLSGTVYHVSGSLVVPGGATLTVQPGAIVKFPAFASALIDGTLDVQASAANPAIFTALTDDSAGGDTNGGGASAGAPGYWRHISVGPTGVITATGLEVRFTGANGLVTVTLSGSAPSSFTDCVFTAYAATAMSWVQGSTAHVVTGCSFTNGGFPIDNYPIDLLATFTNNSASGNAAHDSVVIRSPVAAGADHIPAASMLNGAHIVGATLNLFETVTIESGVVLKMAAFGGEINVYGTLVCNGTAGQPVVFTELRDDASGGDTNKNGAATLPAKGFWRALNFNSTADASSLVHTVVRYAGQAGFAAVRLVDADVTLDHCLIEHGAAQGLDLTGSAALPTVTDCDFQDVTVAIDNVTIPALVGFAGNTASSCTSRNGVVLNQSSFSGSVSLTGDNLIDDTLIVTSGLTLNSGASLTLSEGVIFKFSNFGAAFNVDGTLNCDGSQGEIVFTDLRDDTVGGDAGADGPGTGVPGHWRGLTFSASADASVLDHVRLRFSGQAGFAGVTIQGADLALTDSVIEDCSADGLTLSNMPAAPTISGCAIDRCSRAIVGLGLDQVPNFSNNTASGNAARDIMVVTSTNVTGAVAITKTNLPNGVMEIVTTSTIAAGGSLSLGPGVVVKMQAFGGQLIVAGTLTCAGTLAQPVIFTELRDDAAGGDTNKDGSSSLPAPGQWRGLAMETGSDASVLEHVEVRYSGQASFAGIRIDDTDFSLLDSKVSNCSAAGLQFVDATAMPTIRGCNLSGNLFSIRGASWGNLTRVLDNTASGHGVLDCPLVENAAIFGTVRVNARSMLSGAFVVSVAPSIEAGEVLEFGQGCVVKAATFGLSISSGAGTLNVLGTGLEPVIFTTAADDYFGGDTNKDGPSNGPASYWRGLTVSGVAPCRIEHALIRYSGQSAFPALTCSNPNAIINSVRAQESGVDGFFITAVGGPLENLVVQGAGADGIDLGAGVFADLRFATVTSCATGIRLQPGYTGAVHSSIAWMNTVNYVGTSISNLFNSDGDSSLAGMNGNIHADPLFVDPMIGDLSLQATSPCIDAGEFVLGQLVGGDHDDSSRLNDHDLDGMVGADMGAFEYVNWRMSFAGRPVIGETMTFVLSGAPALAIISVALLDYEYYFPPYGMILVGSPFTLLLQEIAVMNFGYPIVIPDDPSAVGVRFGVQMGAAVFGNLGVGNVAQVYRGVVQD